MITDGERRLIASECREMAYRSEFTAKAVARVLGLTLSGTTRYDHDAWYRLADLIDPEHDRTYHPKIVGTAYHSVIVCSECKHRLDEVTIYCPNCGARLEGVGR